MTLKASPGAPSGSVESAPSATRSALVYNRSGLACHSARATPHRFTEEIAAANLVDRPGVRVN